MRQTFHYRDIAIVKSKRVCRKHHQQPHRVALIPNRRRQNRSHAEPAATLQIHARIHLRIVAPQSSSHPKAFSRKSGVHIQLRSQRRRLFSHTRPANHRAGLCISAIAALDPRVNDRALSPISRKAAVKSVPSELNSYCTVADAAPPLPPAVKFSASRFTAIGSPAALPSDFTPAGQAILNATFGAMWLGALAFSVNQLFNRCRASSGKSENRTPPSPAHPPTQYIPWFQIVFQSVFQSLPPGELASSKALPPKHPQANPPSVPATRRSLSSSRSLCALPVCIDNPASLRSRIMPPVTPSKLANAGVCTVCRQHLRRSPANP